MRGPTRTSFHLGTNEIETNGRALLLSSLGALALLAVPVGRSPAWAQEKAQQASPEQAKAIEAWTASLAVQAATYAAPLVAMYNLRNTVAFGDNPKAPPGQIWRLEDIATPKLAAESGYVSPNVDVLYGFGFADLSAEPVILTAPNSGGRYYMIEVVDMWTNAFAYPAGGAAGYAGGKFAFVGPGWKGTLPPGVERIDCAHAMDRVSASRQRQGRSRSPRRARSPARHHAARPRGIHRPPRATAPRLPLRCAEDDPRHRQQPHEVRRSAAILVDLLQRPERKPAPRQRDRSGAAELPVSRHQIRRAVDSPRTFRRRFSPR